MHLTGAAGFLGRRLLAAVSASGGAVSALVRDPETPAGRALSSGAGSASLEVATGDICDTGRMEAWLAGAETVIHTAGRAVAGPPAEGVRAYFDVNFGGTLSLLEACRRGGVRRFVFLSSAHVYGRPEHLPVDEAHPLNGVHPYAASKIAAEAAVRAYGAATGLETVVLRPSNLYGPGQTDEAVIPTLIKQAAAGRVCPRTLLPVRDYLFVDDAVEAVLLAAARPGLGGAVLNISSGQGASVAELARHVIALRGELGDDREITLGSQTDDTGSGRDEVVCSNAAAGRVLGWAPRTDLRTGLRLTMTS